MHFSRGRLATVMGELVNRGEMAIVPEGFYKQVSSILNAARDKAYTAVNFAMVEA